MTSCPVSYTRKSMITEPAASRVQSPRHPSARRVDIVLFSAILILGIAARTWQFGRVPPGLNPDEASIGVEAYSLLTFGVDRNGMSFPVQFISWGTGQSVPYAYLLMPVVALTHRLSPSIIRFPMLLAGIAALPLMYLLGRWLVAPRFGLLSMFFLAISPWHIVLSRWALDANLFPGFFLAAFVCLLASARKSIWFMPACSLFGLSLYTYATAYAVVPVFMALLLLINGRMHAVGRKPLMLGIVAFTVIALPMGLFLLVNTFGLQTIRLGPITIPRFPVTPRYETQTLLRPSDPTQTFVGNLETAGSLLWTQSDGFVQNTVEPYGYFYKITLPLGVAGIFILADGIRRHIHAWEAALLLAWLGSALVLAGLLAVNVNQFNIIFIPLIASIAVALHWLGERVPIIFPLSLIALAAGFIGFNLDYHGAAYRPAADLEFRTGILPALQYAEQTTTGPICVGQASGQYIYVLYLDHPNPAVFLPQLTFDDPQSTTRNVISLGRYSFGTENCTGRTDWTYVLSAGDHVPRLGNRYEYRFFDNYVVYFPRPS